MDMPGRIRRSWELLSKRVSEGAGVGVGVDARLFVGVLRDWLRAELPAVSTKAAAALRDARGIGYLLDGGDLDSMPIARAAADAFVAALGDVSAIPRDPVAYVAYVDELCGGLAVFSHPDSCCPVCQAAQELWTDDRGAVFEQCTLLGCCFDASGAQLELSAVPAGMRPANRAQVRKRWPDVEFVS